MMQAQLSTPTRSNPSPGGAALAPRFNGETEGSPVEGLTLNVALSECQPVGLHAQARTSPEARPTEGSHRWTNEETAMAGTTPRNGQHTDVLHTNQSFVAYWQLQADQYWTDGLPGVPEDSERNGTALEARAARPGPDGE